MPASDPLTEIVGRLRAIEEKLFGMHYDAAKAKAKEAKENITSRTTSGEDIDLVEISDPELERALEYLRNVRRLMPKETA